MKVSTELMLSLISDIIDNAHLEQSQNFELSLQHFSINELLEEVYELFDTQANGKNLKFTIDFVSDSHSGNEIYISSDKR